MFSAVKMFFLNKLAAIRALPQQRPEIFPSTARELICLTILCSSVATSTIGSGSLQVALPAIAKYYGIAGGDLTWIIASGTLTAGSFLLLFGSLAVGVQFEILYSVDNGSLTAFLQDIVGRRRMLLCSYAWFSIWNLAAGFAKTDVIFDIFRGLAGIGSTYQRGTRKNKAFAILGAFQPLGYVIGITAGGISTQFLSWQSNVWFLAILYTFLTVMTWFYVPSDQTLLEFVEKQEKKGNRMSGAPSVEFDQSILQLLKRVDFVGAGLVTAGFALFVFALTAASKSITGWQSAEVLSCLIIGVLLVAFFVAWQWYLQRLGTQAPVQPLMPLSIWAYPGFAKARWINFLGILMFWTTLWFQEINHATPLGTTASADGHARPGTVLLIIGSASFTVSTLLFALQPANVTYWAMAFPSLCLSVVGADLVYMVTNVFVAESVPNKLKSTASAVFNTVIALASTIGLGAGTAVANSIANKGPGHGESSEDFLLRTYQAAFWLATGATGVGTIVCFFTKIGRQGHDKKGDAEEGLASGPNTTGNQTTAVSPGELESTILGTGKATVSSPSLMQSTMSLDVDDKISELKVGDDMSVVKVGDENSAITKVEDEKPMTKVGDAADDDEISVVKPEQETEPQSPLTPAIVVTDENEKEPKK
ncbi:hypothetical protein Dda_7965 [Drechslerella dactyloides]|uniref:MFS general substrate transporter n=1 Tax=Drechslerella dactyloides TaxID=74499 RepID=A0AAD6NG37_DREDA|nr:hypothetical protein Dda_7965 [Drechslerella dactyloides]